MKVMIIGYIVDGYAIHPMIDMEEAESLCGFESKEAAEAYCKEAGYEIVSYNNCEINSDNSRSIDKIRH